MPDDPKDFLPEPQMECMLCGTLYLITDMAVAQVKKGKKTVICKECMRGIEERRATNCELTRRIVKIFKGLEAVAAAEQEEEE